MTKRLAGGTSIFWLCAATALVLDQATKFAIYHNLTDSREVTVVPGVLFLSAAQNRGVVWGLGREWPIVVFALGILATIGVLVYFHRYCRRSTVESVAWGFIFGGAVGNLVDRATNAGEVKDFIKLVIAGWPWPTFNVADAFITAGAAIIAIVILTTKTPEKAPV